jgi:hypothetical protein
MVGSLPLARADARCLHGITEVFRCLHGIIEETQSGADVADLDRALVVGCDDYPGLAHGNLGGAVRDALAVREWLLRPDGGGLPQDRVTLLASPTAGTGPRAGAQVAPEDLDGPATFRAFGLALNGLVEGPGGRRLYVYLAGHGCRTRPDNVRAGRDAFLFHDFCKDLVSVGSVAVREVYERLTVSSAFEEIVVIVDACRNAPFDRPFEPCGLGVEPVPRPFGVRTPRSVLLQATAPGERACESGDDVQGVFSGDVQGVFSVALLQATASGARAFEASADVRGVFSMALMEGLAGAGTAKTFDNTDTTGLPYRVMWSRLLDYLQGAVDGQTPEFEGTGVDFALAAFPEEAFGPVTLKVEVEPAPDDVDLSGLRVTATWARPRHPTGVGTLARGGPAPVLLQVPPRQHVVQVAAGDLMAARHVDVYADDVVRLELTRASTIMYGDPSATLTGEPATGPGDVGEPVRERRVRVACDDPAAVLELRASDGTVLGRGTGELDVVAPIGWYTATAVGAAGRELREQVVVTPHDEPGHLQLRPVEVDAWPPRRAPSRWSSPSVWAAVNGWGPGGWGTWPGWSAPNGEGTVVVVELGTPPADGTVAVPLDAHPGSGRVQAQVAHTAGPWHLVDVAGLRLRVPVLPAVLTSVVVGTDTISVRLYDLALLGDPVAVLRLDRVQDLLARGRVEAAGVLLTAPLPLDPSGADLASTSAVADALRPFAEGRPAPSAGVSGGLPWLVTVEPTGDAHPSDVGQFGSDSDAIGGHVGVWASGSGSAPPDPARDR